MFIIKQKQQIENVWVNILSIKTLQGVQTAVRKWPNKYEILVIQTLLLINKKFLYCMGLFSDHCMTYKVAGPCCCVRGQNFKIQYFLAKRHLLYLFLLVNFVLYFQMVSPRKRIQSLNNSLSYLSYNEKEMITLTYLSCVEKQHRIVELSSHVKITQVITESQNFLEYTVRLHCSEGCTEFKNSANALNGWLNKGFNFRLERHGLPEVLLWWNPIEGNYGDSWKDSVKKTTILQYLKNLNCLATWNWIVL